MLCNCLMERCIVPVCHILRTLTYPRYRPWQLFLMARKKFVASNIESVKVFQQQQQLFPLRRPPRCYPSIRSSTCIGTLSSDTLSLCPIFFLFFLIVMNVHPVTTEEINPYDSFNFVCNCICAQ